MTTENLIQKLKISLKYMFLVSYLIVASNSLHAINKNFDEDENFTSYKGKVIDTETMAPLVFATVAIEGSNLATVTNTEGKFSLKVPKEIQATNLQVSYIGYKTLEVKLSELKLGKLNTLKMKGAAVALSEVKVFPKDALALISKVMTMRSKNYMNEPILMTAFYRETIKKRKSFVGLSEAVVQVYKSSYSGVRTDKVKLFKGRKSTDSKKLDTLLFKLQGGPYSTLALDIVKDPYMILDDDVIELYEYNIASITRIDNKLNYIIEFKQRPYVTQPLFYGKIYIDVDKLAISSISFNLNTENKSETSAMFIKRKPLGVNVYPTSASYIVNYREQDGKWQYNYSRGEVVFKVNWKKKLFSTNYTTMVEMARTNWELAQSKPFKASDRLKMNVIMEDAINGFADNGFWGEYNIIEPEQSIEVAIRKIKKNLKK